VCVSVWQNSKLGGVGGCATLMLSEVLCFSFMGDFLESYHIYTNLMKFYSNASVHDSWKKEIASKLTLTEIYISSDIYW